MIDKSIITKITNFGIDKSLTPEETVFLLKLIKEHAVLPSNEFDVDRGLDYGKAKEPTLLLESEEFVAEDYVESPKTDPGINFVESLEAFKDYPPYLDCPKQRKV